MLLTRSFYPAGSWRWAQSEFDRLRQEMEHLMGSVGEAPQQTPTTGMIPLLNVTEDANQYTVLAELPGLEPGEIAITVVGKNLTIQGERPTPAEQEGLRYHRRERSFTTFSRTIGLPGEVDPSQVKASSTDGVLVINLPKAETAKPRQISVSAS